MSSKVGNLTFNRSDSRQGDNREQRAEGEVSRHVAALLRRKFSKHTATWSAGSRNKLLVRFPSASGWTAAGSVRAAARLMTSVNMWD